MTQKTTSGLFFLALTLLVFLMYWPGLNGPFVGDDVSNILKNDYVAIDEWTMDEVVASLTSNRSGPLMRPIPALSFGLNYWFAGREFDRFAFKLTNVTIHLLCACFLYALSVRLLHAGGGLGSAQTRSRLAMMATMVWATHPIQLTNVLYVVQRINSLAALAMLAGLFVFVVGRERYRESRAGAWPLMLGGLAGGTLIGLGCKENAILVPGLALLAEATLFRWRSSVPNAGRSLILLYCLSAGLPYLGAALVAVFWFDLWSTTYTHLDFTLGERLLTQTRVVWWYLGQVALPDASQMTFVHDDYRPSRGLLEPWTTAAGLAGLVAAAAVARWSMRFTPWLAFGLGWFAFAHSLEASIVPLELVYEHRNYVPSVGIAVGGVALAWQLLRRWAVSASVPVGVTVGVVTLLSLMTFERATVWSDATTLARVTVERNPDSPRAWAQYAGLLRAQRADIRQIYAAAARAAALDADEVATRVEMLKLVKYMQIASARFGITEQDPLLNPDGTLLLRIGAQGLQAAQEQLGGEVGRVLAGEAIGVVPLIALTDLVACIERRTESCMGLGDQLKDWLATANNNASLGRENHQLFLWIRARLEMSRSQFDRAIETMRQSVALEPSYMPARQQQIFVLIAAKKLAEARQALDAVAKMAVSARDRQQLSQLWEKFKNAQ
jgi:protein O-mannosyl-transferase